jgi:hypothetical protein
MNEPTIITAFYNIRELEQNDSPNNRGIDEYLELAKKFILQLPYPLVIYIDTTESSDKIYEFIQTNRHYKNKTQIVREPFENTYFYKDIDRIRELQQIYPIYNGRLEHETPHYIVLNNNKFWWLEQTIRQNPFSSERFMWMDFGINHVARNVEKIHTWIHDIPEKIRQMCINPLTESSDYKDVFHTIYHHYAGGLFSGSAKYMQKYIDAFKSTTEKIYSENWYQIDEAVMTIVHNENPEWFDDFYGDYAGIIANYKEPEFSWILIFSAIKKYMDCNNTRVAQKILDYMEPVIINQPEYNDNSHYYIMYSIICNYYTNNYMFKPVVVEFINKELQVENKRVEFLIMQNQNNIEYYTNKNELLYECL